MTVVHLQSGNSSKCLSRYVLADCERDKSGSQIMRYNNIFVVIYFCQFCSPIRCSTVLLAYTAQQEWNWIKNSNHHHHHDHNSNFFFFNNLEKSIKKQCNYLWPGTNCHCFTIKVVGWWTSLVNVGTHILWKNKCIKFIFLKVNVG